MQYRFMVNFGTLCNIYVTSTYIYNVYVMFCVCMGFGHQFISLYPQHPPGVRHLSLSLFLSLTHTQSYSYTHTLYLCLYFFLLLLFFCLSLYYMFFILSLASHNPGSDIISLSLSLCLSHSVPLLYICFSLHLSLIIIRRRMAFSLFLSPSVKSIYLYISLS